MKGILFLIIWISGTILHTVYDLKVRPFIEKNKDDWGHPFT